MSIADGAQCSSGHPLTTNDTVNRVENGSRVKPCHVRPEVNFAWEIVPALDLGSGHKPVTLKKTATARLWVG